jgi:hypothetical protein
MKRTLFLCFSGAIVLLTIICFCTAPIINKVIPQSTDWNTDNCKLKEDEYKIVKERSGATKEEIDYYKRIKNECNRKKAMYGLEYSALILDIILGFICAILGILHYFDVGKSFENISGLIGLISGIVGFILTFVYLCYSSYIFTNDPAYGNIAKLNGDGAFAEWNEAEGKFKCLFYKEKNKYSVLAKYSDIGKKHYNYVKDRFYGDLTSEIDRCTYSDTDACFANGHNTNPEYVPSGKTAHSPSVDNCKHLYWSRFDSVSKKYIFDMWITTIIFSCLIIVCDIGLAIFGFLLFNSDGSGL